MSEVSELGTSGRWQVTTATSLYMLDFEEGWVVRVPDAGAGARNGPAHPAVATLRRDHQRLSLLYVVTCGVGQPLIMVIDVVGDGQTTVRYTTEVRHIRQLS